MIATGSGVHQLLHSMMRAASYGPTTAVRSASWASTSASAVCHSRSNSPGWSVGGRTNSRTSAKGSRRVAAGVSSAMVGLAHGLRVQVVGGLTGHRRVDRRRERDVRALVDLVGEGAQELGLHGGVLVAGERDRHGRQRDERVDLAAQGFVGFLTEGVELVLGHLVDRAPFDVLGVAEDDRLGDLGAVRGSAMVVVLSVAVGVHVTGQLGAAGGAL